MNKIGYENVKRYRQLERMDRKDGGIRSNKEFYYVGLKQEIQLFRKIVMKEGSGEGSGEALVLTGGEDTFVEFVLVRDESIGKLFLSLLLSSVVNTIRVI